MSSATFDLPSPESVLSRIKACQEELRNLRRLLRAAQAAKRADEAQSKRGKSSGQADA